MQFRGGVQYHGVFSTVGDITMHVGEYLEYRGDIMSTVGVILSTVDTQYCGDIMSTVGGSSTVEEKSFVI